MRWWIPTRRTRPSASSRSHPPNTVLGHAPPATSTSTPGTTNREPLDPATNHGTAGRNVPTLAEIKDHWPPTVDVPTAGSVFGLSRSHTYELIKRGEFPAKVIQVGSRYRVLTESIIRILADEPGPTPPS